MNLPANNRKWLKEIQLAYSKAEKETLRESKDMLDIYMLAPKYMTKNRGIKTTDFIAELTQTTLSEYARDLVLNPTARESYLFHFVFYYIHCHDYADLVDGMACDRIMEYITENWDLWPEDNDYA